MKLSDKILNLRKQSGMAQEEMAEKLNVSRQTISRWEVGSAQPDALNLLQLSKLFGVTADYLINDEYENDKDVTAVKNAEAKAKEIIVKILGTCITLFGLAGNFVIYVLSRFIKVSIPHITYDSTSTTKWYGNIKGYSYKYFIQEFNLEFLVVLFWLLTVAGIVVVFMNKQKLKTFIVKMSENLHRKK